MYPVKGTTNYYYNDEGHIYYNNEKLTFKLSNSGYYQCNIKHVDGTYKYVHRAIAESAIAKCTNTETTLVVNHIDGNKLNNKITNLEWVSYSENTIHAYENNLISINYGEMHHASKLSDQDRIAIINLILEGATNDTISSMYNLHSRYVSLVRHKKRWLNIWNTNFNDHISIKSSKKRDDNYYHTRTNKGSLTSDQRLEIISLFTTSKLNNAEIASLYKTDTSNISRARNRKLWSYEWSLYDKTLTTIPEMGVEHKPMMLETV